MEKCFLWMSEKNMVNQKPLEINGVKSSIGNIKSNGARPDEIRSDGRRQMLSNQRTKVSILINNSILANLVVI